MLDPALAFVGWHDAQLEQSVQEGTSMRLEFAVVYVSRRLNPSQYAEEVGPAVLTLHDASLQPDSGAKWSGDASWVMACKLSEPLDAGDIQSLARGVGPGRIQFSMHDGSTLAYEFSWAQLTLIGPFEHDEIWEAPPPGK
jgi:hypothetical protein